MNWARLHEMFRDAAVEVTEAGQKAAIIAFGGPGVGALAAKAAGADPTTVAVSAVSGAAVAAILVGVNDGLWEQHNTPGANI